MRLHTSHLTLGKVIPKGKRILFIDTTVKSGGPFVQRCMAPDWGLLTAYKAKQVSKEEYSRHYLVKLFHHKAEIIATLQMLGERYALTDIILGCYCGRGEFCHRHLLSRFLLRESTIFEPGGELQNGNIYRGDEPALKIVSVAAVKDVRDKLYETLSTDLGSHLLLNDIPTPEMNSDDAISVLQAEVCLTAAVAGKAKDYLTTGTGPVFDLSELGKMNYLRFRETDATGNNLFVPAYPTTITWPWYIVTGDYDACLKFLRENKFEPACEINLPEPNPDFDDEMDRYYDNGKPGD